MKLPLHYDTVDTHPASATVYDASGVIIASGVSEEIARRIIAHDTLVAALVYARGAVNDDDGYRDVAEQIDAALALARGEK